MPLLPLTVRNLFSRVRSCPSEQQLAEYADQQAIGNERAAIERHLAFCDECLHQVGFLVRTSDQPQFTATLELVGQARPLGASSRDGSWSWRPAVVALALVLVTFITWRLSTDSSKGSEQRNIAAVQQSRMKAETKAHQQELRGDRLPDSFAFITPKPDAKVSSSALRFQWEPVSETEYYEFELMTESGDLMLRSRLQGTSLVLPSSVHLKQGHSYYVLLRAHSRTLGVVSPALVRFTVE